MSPAELSMMYVATLNAHDFDGFRRLLADPLEYHSLAGPTLTSADEVVEFYRRYADLTPTPRIEIDHLLADEKWAALEVWVFDTETRTETAPRFAVFHQWNNGQLVYYRAYSLPS
jgi:hypothetical protein